MKKYLAICILVFLTSPAYAIGPYFGIGVGSAAATDASSNVQSSVSFLSDNGIASAGTYDDTDVAFAALAGFEITPFLAFEGSYEYLGTYQLHGAFASSTGSVAATLQDTVHTVALTGVVSLPVTPLLSFYVKGGFATSMVDMTCSNTLGGCETSSQTTTKAGGMIGGGVKVRIGPFNSLRVDISAYPNVGDNQYNYTTGNFIAVTAQYIYGF